jgi:hypothetical protein
MTGIGLLEDRAASLRPPFSDPHGKKKICIRFNQLRRSDWPHFSLVPRRFRDANRIAAMARRDTSGRRARGLAEKFPVMAEKSANAVPAGENVHRVRRLLHRRNEWRAPRT